MTNPVPSTDPVDFVFNVGAIDVFASGTANTFTDRLGVVRKTVKGLTVDVDAAAATAINTTIPADVTAVDNARIAAQADIAADVAAVDTARNTAITVTIPGHAAAVDASRISAQSDIAADVLAVEAAKTNALSVAIPAAVSAVGYTADNAAAALASKNTAVSAANQATLLAGVTGVYGTNAAMTADISVIAANANVMVLADESRQGQVGIYKKVSGAMVYQGVVHWNAGSTGGIGDVDPEGTIYIFPGDSTTEQAGASGFMFDTLTLEYRTAGGALQRIVGTINFGGSGHKLADWVNGALGTIPTYSTSNLGVGQNDYFGHKAVGGTSLLTQLAWRGALSANIRTVWAICYGINDCILDASVGNLSQQGITDYVSGYLRQAIRRIQSAFPADKIMLRTPNPMTARPYNPAAGFPSAVQYPSFGADDAADQALVEKWNQGLRNGYFNIRQEFPGVVIFDKWELVYGRSDTTKTAGTQLPFLGDLVHPSGNGYVQEAHQIVSFFAPKSVVKRRQLTGRHAWAVAYAAANSVQPWEQWPPYLDTNYKYQFVIEGIIAGKGASYLDITLKPSEFSRVVQSRGIYIQVGTTAAQYFATYSQTDLGGTDTVLRLSSISMSAAMQSAWGAVRIYCDPLPRRIYGVGIETTLNQRGFLTLPDALPNGGTFSASTGVAVPSTVTVEIAVYAANVRTVLGTITIGANAINGTLASGNPTAFLAAGTRYEAKVTSSTVAGQVFVSFTPS